MNDLALRAELSKKLAKDLGGTPFSIGKAGLTHSDLLAKEQLKISDGSIVKSIPMWYGEVSGGEGLTCCLLAALEPDPDKLEIACVVGFKSFTGEFQTDSAVIGFIFDWGTVDDPGHISIKNQEGWLPSTLAQRLQLSLGFENMIQDGVIFNKSKIPKELLSDMSELINVDDNSE